MSSQLFVVQDRKLRTSTIRTRYSYSTYGNTAKRINYRAGPRHGMARVPLLHASLICVIRPFHAQKRAPLDPANPNANAGYHVQPLPDLFFSSQSVRFCCRVPSRSMPNPLQRRDAFQVVRSQLNRILRLLLADSIVGSANSSSGRLEI